MAAAAASYFAVSKLVALLGLCDPSCYKQQQLGNTNDRTSSKDISSLPVRLYVEVDGSSYTHGPNFPIYIAIKLIMFTVLIE